MRKAQVLCDHDHCFLLQDGKSINGFTMLMVRDTFYAVVNEN